MKIIFYKNKAENNRIDKRNYITEYLSMEGVLKEQTSIIAPSVLISTSSDIGANCVVDSASTPVVDSTSNLVCINPETRSISLESSLFMCNYCYIEDFNRYYFINDIVSVSNHLWLVSLNTDVLMSFRLDLAKLTCFVERSSIKYNRYITDTAVLTDTNRTIESMDVSKGDLVDTSFSPNFDLDSYYMTITVLNNCKYDDIREAAPPTGSGLPEVGSWMVGNGTMCNTYCISRSILNKLAAKVYEDDSLASYILSLNVYPFEIKRTSLIPLNIKGHDLDGINVYTLDFEAPKYMVLADFTLESYDFRDYEPFTRYEIYLPYSGWTTISADDILDKHVIVYYVVDYKSCSGQAVIYNMTDQRVIYTTSVEIGVAIPLNTTNNREYEAQEHLTKISTTTKAVAGALMVAAGGHIALGAGTLAAGLAAGGKMISSGAGSIYSAGLAQEKNDVTNILRGSGSVTSANLGLYQPQTVTLKKTKLTVREYNMDYAKLVGRPCNCIRELGAASGEFVKVGHCNINFEGALQEERTLIKQYLQAGVYN